VKKLDRFIRAVGHRIGWETSLGPWLFKTLPPRTGWTATLGALSLMIFATMFVSGVFLAMHYNPSPDKAYQSVDYIMNDLPGGWLLRGLHHWGASAMVIAVFLHMMTGFFSGSYKKPRELTWISGVVLLLIVLGLGFTGYLLPWDLKAYWATTVSTNIPKDLPLVGDFVSRLMLGGDSVSGSTLTRFYAVHAMLLPALLVAVLAFHIYLVRVHGISGEEEASDAEPSTSGDADATPTKPYRFYPEHAWRSTIVYAVGLLVLIGLSIFAHIPREQVAGTQVESYLPRPEWYYMWLFQLLTYFPGKWEAVGSLLIPFVGVTLLFALPFLDRSRRIGLRNRPLPLAAGVTAIVGITYLTAMGFAGAKPYGQTVLVPDRALTASETRGLYLYADRDCAYCHQIDGKGGRRAGPDLSNMVAKDRTQEHLARYIRDPQAVDPSSVMPKYPLPDEDLKALADFVLALDFGKHGMRTVTRGQALGQNGTGGVQLTGASQK
jgi:quinol-cytochrome oxidoreductase complex cytochrome b subunit